MNVETRPLVPLTSRYRAAARRLTSGFGSAAERSLAAQCFAESVDNLRRLGLPGPGLIIAAEHMAKSRLRAGCSFA